MVAIVIEHVDPSSLEENQAIFFRNIIVQLTSHYTKLCFNPHLLEKYEVYNKTNAARAAFVKALQHTIASLDLMINTQINQIIHHDSFQALEASWRGLDYLLDELQGIRSLKIKMLDVTLDTLARDLKYSLEFDQSLIFKKIYSTEFDTPGGEPFGLLIGDYYISHRAYSKDGINQLETLYYLGKVAAAAFAPLITAASPELFGLDSFSELQPWLNLLTTLQQEEYRTAKFLQDDEDSRFIGLVLPRVLMREPYLLEKQRINQLCFTEAIAANDDYLWGNAAYCFATVVGRSFETSGWFADIRGTERDCASKGLVLGLPQHTFSLDRLGTQAKPVTEAWISSTQENALANAGLIALCGCQYTPYPAFYSCQSIQRPKNYDREPGNVNAALSSSLNYILCVSRFAHYIKMIVRDKVGSFITPQACENFLQRWIINYTANISNISDASKAQYPLREAKVEVREHLGKPGSYFCIIHLCPHFQIDDVEIQFTFTSQLDN